MPRPSCRPRAIRKPALQATALSALVCCGAACLVTDEVNYDRPNTPAQLMKVGFQGIRSVPTQPDCTKATNGAGPGWLLFRTTVWDPDVEDTLEVRVIINGKSIYGTAVKGNGGVQREEIDYCAPKSFVYDKPCLHVEILVSRFFSDRLGQQDPYKTEDPNDVGYADWWLVGPTDDFPEVGVTACQKLEQSGLDGR